MELAEAFGLLRLEELRKDIRADLDAACYWEVSATGLSMEVQVGPHRVGIPESHPVLYRADLIVVGLVDGKVMPVLLPGAPSASSYPVTPKARGRGLPMAVVNVRACATRIGNWDISKVTRPAPTGRPEVDRSKLDA